MWGDILLLTSFFLQVGDGTFGTNRLTPVAVVGLGSGVANVALGEVRLFCRGMFFWGFCVASLCAAVIVVVVVCAVLGCCGVLGLRSGKCLWLIAPCGWVVLWRDEGGRDVKFCMRVSCMICSRIRVLF